MSKSAVDPNTVETTQPQSSDLSAWNRFLSHVMRHLRAQRPDHAPKEHGWFIEQTQYWGKPYELPLAWFVTNGCSWSAAGSCTMCNFGTDEGIGIEKICWQVDRILERVKGLPIIYVTPLGSMFDDVEVPAEARQAIFYRLARSGCRIFGTESRPETITDDKMAEFRKMFGPTTVLQIGLGLESADPYVQRNCINKGLREADYVRAVTIMKKYHIQAMVHVLLKPLFLSEAEAIEDALYTINWAFEHGADRIIFFMTNLKPYTLASWLRERGRYRVPYVWSGLQVLRNMKPQHQKHFTLSGLYSGIPILQTAYNCPNCTSHMIEGLQRYSNRLDPSMLDELDRYPCACRDEWRQAVQSSGVQLPDRLAGEYKSIGLEMFGDAWWDEARDWVLSDLEQSRHLWQARPSESTLDDIQKA